MYNGIMDSTNMSWAYYLSTFYKLKAQAEEQKKLLLMGKVQ